MSSSLSSIILIGVVWLLIITTLFMKRHTPVRRTSKALTETRVVHEGGAGIERPRRRPLPAESLYLADPDAHIELVEAEPEQVVIDDTRDPVVPAVVDGDVVSYRSLDDEDTGQFAPVSVDDRSVVAGTDDADDIDVVDDADYTDDTEDTEVTAEDDTDNVVADVVDEDVEDEAVVEAELLGEPTDDAADTPEPRTDHRFSEVDIAYIRGGDIDIAVGTDDELPLEDVSHDGDDWDDGEDEDDTAGVDESDELTEDDLDFLASRRGRGLYDPVASRKLAENRDRRRRRVFGVLAAVTVLTAACGMLLGGALWWTAAVVGAVLTGTYLYTLRKLTVAERKQQHQRLTRWRRARLGVRNTVDRELGVPDRLQRPGAVVLEIDDSDPEFADLDYADITFADDVVDDGYGEPFEDSMPTIRVV